MFFNNYNLNLTTPRVLVPLFQFMDERDEMQNKGLKSRQGTWLIQHLDSKLPNYLS